MRELATRLYSAEHVRQIDHYAIEQLGIPGYTLMMRAGAAALRALQTRWPLARRVLVVCGAGNNAGDGYVLARLAAAAGLDVSVVALFDPATLRGDALRAHRDFEVAGGRAQPWNDSLLKDVDVIVDAIFGTGLSRALDAELAARVRAMNAARVPILALDIPSGLHADTGLVMGAAVRASCTITFVGLKLGLYLGEAPDYVGQLEFDDLDIPPDVPVAWDAVRLDVGWLQAALIPRSRVAHKGANGQVLLVGGNLGMAGAARLAGEAALRVGSGLVTVVTRAENVAAITAGRPELIVRTGDADSVHSFIERADVIAIGPGLGQDGWAQGWLAAALASERPKVVDADALNVLARAPQRREDWILTPHPGEAGRLLGTSATAVQADRLGAVRALQAQYGGIVVLKGANTLMLRTGEVPAICDRGNPAMATPGMGDVLTGVIAGLLAQLKDPWTAARVGVLVHALAGERAAAQLGDSGRAVDRGLISSDLFAHLPACVSPGGAAP